MLLKNKRIVIYSSKLLLLAKSTCIGVSLILILMMCQNVVFVDVLNDMLNAENHEYIKYIHDERGHRNIYKKNVFNR